VARDQRTALLGALCRAADYAEEGSQSLVGQGLRADALGIITELRSSLLSDIHPDAERRQR